MIENLLARWAGLAPRERRFVAGGALLVVATIVYLALFEPAWQGRRQLERDLPPLRGQVARMSSLAAEVTALERLPSSATSASAVRSRLESSLAAAGLAEKAEFKTVGERIELRIALVDFGAWIEWVDLAVREVRVRVIDASAVRDPRSGFAAVRVAFELPGGSSS